MVELPKNDDECKKILHDVCDRSEEQINAIFQFAELIKEMKNMIGIEPEVLKFWLRTFERIQPQIRSVLPIEDVKQSIRQIKERLTT